MAASAAPVDTLLTGFSAKHKSRAAQRIAQATREMESGKFAAARVTLTPLLKDRTYIDYAHALTAEAQRREARAALEQGKSGVAPLLRSAIQNLSRIEIEQAYSPFIPMVPVELARTELLLGSALSIGKQDAEAQRAFESAFQRLAVENAFTWIEPKALDHYVASCRRKTGPQCGSWNRRLLQAFPRVSPEYKALAAWTPPAPAASASPIASTEVVLPNAIRGNQAYKTPDADQAAIDEALALAIDGKERAARQAFQKFIDEYPRSAHRHRARYWIAKLLKGDGESDSANQAFESILAEAPLSFYGLLASFELGKSARELISGELPSATDVEPTLTPLEAIRIQRAQQFLAEKQKRWAALELKEIRGKDSFSSEFLVYLSWLHHEAESHLGAFRVLQTLIDRGSSYARTSFVVRMVFPVTFYESIQKAAQEAELDPVLVLSLIKQESAFETQIASSAGASGLMQLMYTTAIDVDPQVARRDLKQAEANLRIGTRYLKQMLKKYDGSIALALSAYNAGPGNTDKWVKAYGIDKGLLDFVERIPFKETREYVTSIIRNYSWYAPLVPGGDPLKPLEAFWKAPKPAPAPAPSESPTTAPTAAPSAQ